MMATIKVHRYAVVKHEKGQAGKIVYENQSQNNNKALKDVNRVWEELRDLNDNLDVQYIRIKFEVLD